MSNSEDDESLINQEDSHQLSEIEILNLIGEGAQGEVFKATYRG